MYIPSLVALLGAIMLATTSSAAQGQTLSIETTASTIGHRLEGPTYTLSHIAGASHGAEAIPSFSARLSDYSDFSYTISAPEGYIFQVDSLPGATIIINFNIAWYGDGISNPSTQYLPTTVTFADLQGTQPSYDLTGMRGDTNGRVLNTYGGSSMWFPQSSSFSFSEIKLSSSLASVTGATTTRNYVPFLGGQVYVQHVFSVPNVDPGPPIRLVAVIPEPSTILMLVIGLALMLFRIQFLRRRTAFGAA
jgi:hypothetical protein